MTAKYKVCYDKLTRSFGGNLARIEFKSFILDKKFHAMVEIHLGFEI